MSEKTKKILQILGFIGLTALFSYGLYYILFGANRTAQIDQEIPSDQISGEFPSAGQFDEGRIPVPGEQPAPISPQFPDASIIAQGGETLVTQLTNSRIIAPIATSNNQARFYDPNDGRFYQIDASGRLQSISQLALPGAENVIFSNDAARAILEFPDGSNLLYDINQNRQITIPRHWESFAFTPDGQQIAAKAIIDQNNAQLVALSTNGSQARVIANMGSNADLVKVAWSANNNFVALSNTGPAQAGLGRNAILLIDQNGQAPGSIIVDGTNFSPKWTPSGTHIVYSSSDPNLRDRPSLWYVRASGQEIGNERVNLGVATWIEKCTFKDDTFMICAVPREIPDYEGFDHRLNRSIDDLYEINVTTGRKVLLANPVTNVRMFDLTVSPDRSQLFFTDQNGTLNTIRLR
jgi:hypothetical protein